jgi:hypothetical protein
MFPTQVMAELFATFFSFLLGLGACPYLDVALYHESG